MMLFICTLAIPGALRDAKTKNQAEKRKIVKFIHLNAKETD